MPAVLITGGSRGIGRELVNLLSDNGFYIITTSRSNESVELLNKLTNVEAYCLDLTNDKNIDSFCDKIKNNGIELFSLINNAGTSIMGSLEYISAKERLNLYKTNFIGPISLTLQLLDNFKDNGKIINISSDESLITLPQSVDYSISKHAFQAFSEGLGYEVKQRGIDVISILPGLVGTSLTEKIIDEIEKRSITTKNNLTFQRFLQEKEFIVNQIKLSKHAINPVFIANKVLDILNSDTLHSRILITSPSETEYLINELIDQLVLLNSTTDYRFTMNELFDKIKFSYQLINQD